MDLLFNAFQKENFVVIKTNHIFPHPRAGKDEKLTCECLNWMKSVGTLLHPHRRVEDVIVSGYYYQLLYDEKLRRTSIGTYLTTPRFRSWVDSWIRTESSWMQQNGILPLEFSDLRSPFPHFLDQLALRLNMTWRDPKKKLSDYTIFHHEDWKLVSGPPGYRPAQRKPTLEELLSPSSLRRLVEAVQQSEVFSEPVITCDSIETTVQPVEVCTSKGETFIPQNCAECQKIFPQVGDLKTGAKPTELWAPKSCPPNLITASSIARINGEKIASHHEHFAPRRASPRKKWHARGRG